MRAAHFHGRLQKLFLTHAVLTADIAECPGRRGADQFGKNMLHADVFIAQTPGQFFRQSKTFGQTLGDADALPFHTGATYAGTPAESLFQRGGKSSGGKPHALHNARHEAVFLAQQRQRHMLDVHFLMFAGVRKVLSLA